MKHPMDAMIVQVHLAVPHVELAVSQAAQREMLIQAVEAGFLPLQKRGGMYLEKILQQRNDGEPEKPDAVSSRPEDWRCGACDGQMVSETTGMFSGKRWVHTCGVTYRQRLAEEAANE